MPLSCRTKAEFPSRASFNASTATRHVLTTSLSMLCLPVRMTIDPNKRTFNIHDTSYTFQWRTSDGCLIQLGTYTRFRPKAHGNPNAYFGRNRRKKGDGDFGNAMRKLMTSSPKNSETLTGFTGHATGAPPTCNLAMSPPH